ncbi:MAG TPA: DMT family transporter [Acidimicrobiia bacterium]|nr:DMT family transporter [Acidimicrobiia bacterium]
MTDRRRTLADRLGDGASRAAFDSTDWALLLTVSGIFGSAFLWISIALRSLEPGVIAVGRLVLAAGAIVLIPRARRRIDRADWAIVAIAGLIGQGAPAYLFAAAEKHISSALTGMLVAGVPIIATAISVGITRRRPGRFQVGGLAIGLVGMVMLAGPDLVEAGGSALGVGMVLVAVCCYAVSNNLYPRVAQTYGSLPISLWGQALSAIVLLPVGIADLSGSRVEPLPIVALVILGVVGTGIARALLVTLVGRVGPRRAPVMSYLIPVVALVLGVAVLGESVTALQVAGVAVAMAGGFLVTRAE